MAKITREELIDKINNYDGVNDDIKIELMEDITDSFDDSELVSLREEISNTKTELDDLKRKYKERFSEVKEVKKDEVDDIYKEKEYIDVKEI